MKKIIVVMAAHMLFTAVITAQQVGIGTNTPTNTLEVVATVNASSLASVMGTNNGVTGAAITGSSNAAGTRAVTGFSSKGFGVQGYTNNNIGISGFTLGGTALNAVSNSGYALQVSGNLKIAGGNTNPSNGAVLTSDAAGNATWKKSNVAFLGEGTTGTGYTSGVFKKVEFANTSYDLQNNFLDYNSGTTPATSSTFTAPVAGIYHFSSSVSFSISGFGIPADYFRYAQIRIVRNSANVLAMVVSNSIYSRYSGSDILLQVHGDYHLDANDQVYIEAMQINQDGDAASLQTSNYLARFSGHLIVAD